MILQMLFRDPLRTPYLFIDIFEYWEQEGVYRQNPPLKILLRGPWSGERVLWYRLMIVTAKSRGRFRILRHIKARGGYDRVDYSGI